MMLRFFLMLASFANAAAGLVLIATWTLMWQHIPIVAAFIGASLLIQGAYTILYVHGELGQWGDVATGALFAGQALALCVGILGVIQAILHNLNTGAVEIAPVLAGALMLVQALLTLAYLIESGLLRPRSRRSSPYGRSSP